MTLFQEISERSRRLTKLFNMELPIFGMPAYSFATPEMVASLCEAGTLGVLPAGFHSPAQIRKDVTRIRELTNRSFAIEIFAPQATVLDLNLLHYLDEALAPLREELGLEVKNRQKLSIDYEAQFETILELKVPVVGISLGGLREPFMERLEKQGILSYGVASTLKDAKVLRASGVHAVVAQGLESGGFISYCESKNYESQIGGLTLFEEVSRALEIPVIAKGGLMTARSLLSARVLGASGVALSSAFLGAVESSIPQQWKQAIAYLTDGATNISRIFTGREARVLRNAFAEVAQEGQLPTLPFPYQWLAMNDIFECAKKIGRLDLYPLMIGQMAYLAQQGSVVDIVNHLRNEYALLTKGELEG